MKPERGNGSPTYLTRRSTRAPKERAAFLEEACEGDRDLRKQVERLVKSHEESGEFHRVSGLCRRSRTSDGRSRRRIGGRIDWSLPDRVSHRHWRNGRGLSGAGRATRAQSRAQASPRALDDGRDAVEPVQK